MSDNSEIESPFAVALATVVDTAQISPSFARITFGGAGLRDFGNPEHVLDQRIKLIFPGENGRLPTLANSSADWYSDWVALPETERGSMRTYSIRDLHVDEDGDTRVVIDFVLHLAPGASGPASRWAAQAEVGDQLLLIGPRRGRLDGGGIEYLPDTASRVFLIGDETAAPAIARILEESADMERGGPQITAFVEIPQGTDILDVRLAPGQELLWLARGDRTSGAAIIPEVMRNLGLSNDTAVEVGSAPPDTTDGSTPWETPTYTNLPDLPGGDVRQAAADSPTVPRESSYFWIAGESSLVTTLRRYLVRDLGIDRSRVAFMGYWRRGVAMRG